MPNTVVNVTQQYYGAEKDARIAELEAENKKLKELLDDACRAVAEHRCSE